MQISHTQKKRKKNGAIERVNHVKDRKIPLKLNLPFPQW